MNIHSVLALLCLGVAAAVATPAQAERRDGVWVLQSRTPHHAIPDHRHAAPAHRYDPRSPYSHYPHYPRNLPPRYQGQLPPRYYERQRGVEIGPYRGERHPHAHRPPIRDGRDHRLHPPAGRSSYYRYERY